MDWCEKNLRGRTKVRQKESEKMSEAIKSKSLVQLAQGANALVDQIIEAGGELTPELEQALSISEKDIAVKADSYYVVMSAMEAREKELKALADDLASAARSLANQKKALTDRLKMAMESMDRDELKGDVYRFKLSTGKPSLVINDDSIGDDFKHEVVTTKINKKLIEEKLKAGEKVSGAYYEPTLMLRKYVNKGGK